MSIIFDVMKKLSKKTKYTTSYAHLQATISRFSPKKHAIMADIGVKYVNIRVKQLPSQGTPVAGFFFFS